MLLEAEFPTPGAGGEKTRQGPNGLGRLPSALQAGCRAIQPFVGVTTATGSTTCHAMSLFRDQPPPPSPSAKPKLSAEERRRRHEDRLKTIRLRMAIGHELDERGITTPAAIGAALGMPAAEAVKLMNRHRWHEGDVALLEAAAARLGVQTPGP